VSNVVTVKITWMCYGWMARNHVRNMDLQKGNGLLPGAWTCKWVHCHFNVALHVVCVRLPAILAISGTMCLLMFYTCRHFPSSSDNTRMCDVIISTPIFKSRCKQIYEIFLIVNSSCLPSRYNSVLECVLYVRYTKCVEFFFLLCYICV
jgi:hypothetical protein